MELEALRNLQENCEQILDKLEIVPADPSQIEEWVPKSLDECIANLKQAAQKTAELASSPVKIGVMGEFSSGKSLLLGSLIGYADAIPVSENPTTGNVTAIYLTQSPQAKTTEVLKYEVEYLSEQGIRECLAFMLQELEKRSLWAQLPPEQMIMLKQLNPESPSVWNGLENWGETAWNTSQNLELRYLIRELINFSRTYHVYGILCNQKYKIDPATAKEGLTLPDLPLNVQAISFEDLTTYPAKLPKVPPNLAPKLLQLSFPLIKRIEIEVLISKQVWDLGDSRFILLDFPGLGAANSGIRDSFLSLRELAEVQTILILLNAKSPGSDRATKIYTMMEQQRPNQNLKDLILVGVGRFDQLPLSEEETKLDRLVSGSEINKPLTEEQVFQSLKVLKTTLEGAGAFTQEGDRIVLVSPLLSLAKQAKNTSYIKAGSPEFLARLDSPHYLEVSYRMQNKWDQLSVRLLETTPGSSLGRKLGYFSFDGGIGKLRDLIKDHVKTHGLAQLLQDAQRSANMLKQELSNLKTILNELADQGITVTENPNLVTLRQTLSNLDRTYQDLKTNLGKEPLKDRRGIEISNIVKEKLSLEIFSWSQWTELFNKSQEGIIISSTERRGAAAKLFDKLKTAQKITEKSDDLYPIFGETIKKLKKFTEEQIKQGIQDFINKLSARIKLERSNIEGLTRSELLADIEQKFGQDESSLFEGLMIAIEPTKWEEIILGELFNEMDQSLDHPEMIFPLARADHSHPLGQVFDWGIKNREERPIPANNLILLLRIRHELTASATLHLVEYVSLITKKLYQEIEDILNDVIPVIKDISKNEALLQYIASGEDSKVINIPAWLQTLSQLTTDYESQRIS